MSKPMTKTQLVAALAEEMDKEVTEMLRLGVIEPSTSNYVNPVIVVRKLDGKLGTVWTSGVLILRLSSMLSPYQTRRRS